MGFRFTPTYPSETINLWRSLTSGAIDGSKKPGSKTVVIAEAGTAHLGLTCAALDLVECAKKASADVVKFQCFDDPIAGMFCWIDGDEERADRWYASRMSYGKWAEVADHAKRVGIHLMLSCFEAETIKWAEALDLPCMKVASRAAQKFPWHLWTGPALMSNGMWQPSMKELALLPKNVVQMQCTAEYPAEVPWKGYAPGYSSHSKEPFLAIDAIRAGAAFVEVHFQDCEYDPGPDEPVSLIPIDLVTVCEARDYYYNQS